MRDLPGLFVIYGVGFALQMAMLALLYLRALEAAPALRLNAVETLRTQQEIALHAVLAVTGVVSALSAGLLPPHLGVWAGFVYMTLPLTMPVVAVRYAARVARAKAHG